MKKSEESQNLQARVPADPCKSLKKLVSRAGLEPATPCLKGASPSNLRSTHTIQVRKKMENTSERWVPSCGLVWVRLVAAW